MVLDNWRGKRVSDGEWITGSLCMKYNPKGEEGALLSPHINEELIVPKTLGQCTGMHDKRHKFIYEDDMVVLGDHAYRVVRHPETKEFGLLLILDVVEHPMFYAKAFKLHKPLIDLEKAAEYIQPMVRAEMREALIIGDCDTMLNKAAIIDVSKVEGDKEEYIKSCIEKQLGMEEVDTDE